MNGKVKPIMFLVKPSFKVIGVYGADLSIIEEAGRTCYKSEVRIGEKTAIDFTKKILKRGHESVIEHSAITVKFVIDRGVSHELVRHRLCAFSQESTRYCNYKGGVTFVIPPWIHIPEGEYVEIPSGLMFEDYKIWVRNCIETEKSYVKLMTLEGWLPQQARAVLLNSLKTEIVVTANFREWRHIFKLRCSEAAHPQMREVMVPLREELRQIVPVVFDSD